jgi:hypothetical protein
LNELQKALKEKSKNKKDNFEEAKKNLLIKTEQKINDFKREKTFERNELMETFKKKIEENKEKVQESTKRITSIFLKLQSEIMYESKQREMAIENFKKIHEEYDEKLKILSTKFSLKL